MCACTRACVVRCCRVRVPTSQMDPLRTCCPPPPSYFWSHRDTDGASGVEKRVFKLSSRPTKCPSVLNTHTYTHTHTHKAHTPTSIRLSTTISYLRLHFTIWRLFSCRFFLTSLLGRFLVSWHRPHPPLSLSLFFLHLSISFNTHVFVFGILAFLFCIRMTKDVPRATTTSTTISTTTSVFLVSVAHSG